MVTANAPKFSFGNLTSAKATPTATEKTTAAKPAASSFADQFKPKAGSWSCKACYTSNGADVLYCACCEEPKDDTVPKKGQANSFSLNGKSHTSLDSIAKPKKLN